MVLLKTLFVLLASSALVLDALLLPKLIAASVPFAIGGKILAIPKIVALKAGIGLTGLNIAGAKLLKSKVAIPAAIAGASAGLTLSSAMQAPRVVGGGRTLAVHGRMITNFPSQQLVTYPAVQASYQVPGLPTMHTQQQVQQTFTVNPRTVVYQQPLYANQQRVVYQQPIYANPQGVVYHQPSANSVTIGNQPVNYVMQTPSVPMQFAQGVDGSRGY